MELNSLIFWNVFWRNLGKEINDNSNRQRNKKT